MKKADLKIFRQRLLALRARLRGEYTQLADSALNNTGNGSGVGDRSSMPIHMADLGSDAFEQEFTLSLMEREEDTLEAIESALERIDAGTYGECEECGGQIRKDRLTALPFTPLCVKCAAKTQR
jgi:DnaK suppressor protein